MALLSEGGWAYFELPASFKLAGSLKKPDATRVGFVPQISLRSEVKIRHLFVELPAGDHILSDGFEQHVRPLGVRLT